MARTGSCGMPLHLGKVVLISGEALRYTCARTGMWYGAYVDTNCRGRLVFNVFDLRLEILAAHSGQFGSAIKKLMEFANPHNGHRMIIWDSRQYDCKRQVLVEDRILEELDDAGRVISRNYATLMLRYNTRYEMLHLLNLCRFEVEALYGDFARGPFRYGGEQVCVARRIGS